MANSMGGDWWECGVCHQVVRGQPRCWSCHRVVVKRQARVSWLAWLIVAGVLGWWIGVATAGVEVQLQPLLDLGRTVVLDPNTEYALEAPLRVGSRARIVGGGFTSVLRYSGPGETAVVLGDVAAPAYGWEARDFAVVGGGVLVARCSDLCLFQNVWVQRAPGAGVTVDGPGDRFVLERAVVRECGSGIVVRSNRANNGLVLSRCSIAANRGYGVVAETYGAFPAHLQGLRLEGCTIQGNCTELGLAGAEVLIRGAVSEAVILDVHFESPWSSTGLRIERADGLVSSVRVVDGEQVVTVGSRAPRNVRIRESRFDPIVPGRAAIEVSAMEGVAGTLSLADSRLRMPIWVAAGVPAVEQKGPHLQAVEVMDLGRRPP